MAFSCYTPKFIDFCKDYIKVIPFGLKNEATGELNNMADFTPQNAQKLFQDLERCNDIQLQFIKDFAEDARQRFEAANQAQIQAGAQNQQQAQAAHQKQAFFNDLEKRLELISKKKAKYKGQNPNGAEGHSSYKPSAVSGQSFYDSMMHILGYDATTVGASSMFFLVFSALRFMVGSPYWEQVAEYHANKEKQFNPNNLTDAQLKLNLSKDSTRDEIMQAGFLPPPDLASAFDIEFKTFMNKMGNMTKLQDNNLNQLGAGLLHPKAAPPRCPVK